jgi:LEA14-like dessication related protein
MKRDVRVPVLLALVGALATFPGCAGILFSPDPPRVTLADLHVAEVRLLEQKYRLELRIQNPNPFELHIEGLDYELSVNEQPFSSGVSAKPLTVGPYATEILEVEAFSDVSALLRQLRKLEKENLRKLPYRLKGHARLSKGGVRLPFDHRGELSLGGSR